MAWNATLPTDDSLLINTPGYLRSNWDAIALGTDAALLITNAKVAANAAIVDTKLAQITTAEKVSGTALTLLPNIPAAAGVIPSANLTSVAQKGANTDITSLGGLTTPLSTAQGGTGSTANANAASGVVILDASSKLPAVDGGLLTGVGWNSSGVGIFDGNAPTTFTDLDLSATIGTQKTLVMIKVENNHASAAYHFAFRTNGETKDVGQLSSANEAGAGASGARIDTGHLSYIMVETDASGIVEWLCQSAVATVLTLVGYIK